MVSGRISSRSLCSVGPGETVQQRGEEGAIGRLEARCVGVELALEHGELVA
jgi:hypothetical protein